jgi:FkbH-like protein
MTENIRLLVWDLDETFWSGTLTEGGYTYSQANHDIVIELARRGIVSSICSKNDPAVIKAALEAHGIWDYFIFPSISWDSKGPRLAALIETIQLRPETVLFIDDNSMNRAEALHCVKGIRVSDETIIGALLDDPQLRGMDDHNLSRLKQYKLLERRKHDAQNAQVDTKTFLRSSRIKVKIDHDVEANIDRAIELVNRTNQLNFTKKRFSEDVETARGQMRALLAAFNRQVGLVHVEDRYGDYGYCGFYALTTEGKPNVLEHFCFSCRILNMGVEQWVYHAIGRPVLNVVGDVLTDLNAMRDCPDWVNLSGGESDVSDGLDGLVGEVIARGGCNIGSLVHYFQVANTRLTSEVNLNRNGVDTRLDHSILLRYGILGLSGPEWNELELMGFSRSDSESALFRPQEPNPIWILSMWSDADFQLYKHKQIGLRIPVSLFFPGRPINLTKLHPSQLPSHLRTPPVIAMVERLATEYVLDGYTSQAMFKENLQMILDRAPRDATVFLLANNEMGKDKAGNLVRFDNKARLNVWMRDVVEGYSNVTLVDTARFLGPEDSGDPNHLHRAIHYRIFQFIKDRITLSRRAHSSEVLA